MYSCINENGKLVVADEYEKGSKVYCPVCHGELTFKNGRIKVKHFAHKVSGECRHGEGETNEHLKVKQYLYKYFREKGIEVYPECTFWKDIRPDVAVNLNGKWIGFEVQKSQISIDDINERMRRNNEHGIYNLWILPENEYWKMKRDRFRLSEQNIYLKNLYYGYLYVYADGAIHCTSPQNATTYVNEFYNHEYGDMVGGYTKKLKKTFENYYDHKFDLLQDFKFQDKPAYSSRYSFYPACKVYCRKASWEIKK